MSIIIKCPLCGQQIDLDGYEECIECGEYVCHNCYNPTERKCAECKKAKGFLKN